MSEDITAEFEVSEIAPEASFKVRPKLSIACKTDLGRVRDNNEDKFEYFIPESDLQVASKGMVFVVCDGMGGHEAGQIASEMACKTFIDVYLNHPANQPGVALRAGIQAANRFVLDVARAIPSRKGMGTTLSSLTILQDMGWIAHVGDSRIYRLRDQGIEMMTVDHTWVHEAITQGLITPEMAETHPYRHMLTRAIGVEDTLQPDVFPIDLKVGDVYLLCSDGLMNHVDDETIGQIVGSNGLSEASWKLVGQALLGGGSDNCTVLLVRVDALEPVS